MPEYCYRCPEDNKKVAIGKTYISRSYDPIQQWAVKKYFGGKTDVRGKTIQCCLKHVSPPASPTGSASRLELHNHGFSNKNAYEFTILNIVLHELFDKRKLQRDININTNDGNSDGEFHDLVLSSGTKENRKCKAILLETDEIQHFRDKHFRDDREREQRFLDRWSSCSNPVVLRIKVGDDNKLDDGSKTATPCLKKVDGKCVVNKHSQIRQGETTFDTHIRHIVDFVVEYFNTNKKYKTKYYINMNEDKYIEEFKPDIELPVHPLNNHLVANKRPDPEQEIRQITTGVKKMAVNDVKPGSCKSRGCNNSTWQTDYCDGCSKKPVAKPVEQEQSSSKKPQKCKKRGCDSMTIYEDKVCRTCRNK